MAAQMGYSSTGLRVRLAHDARGFGDTGGPWHLHWQAVWVSSMLGGWWHVLGRRDRRFGGVGSRGCTQRSSLLAACGRRPLFLPLELTCLCVMYVPLGLRGPVQVFDAVLKNGQDLQGRAPQWLQ